MRLLASQIAEATGGRLAGPDVEVVGASFDSRTTRPGELFVPIVAERDGHDFIDAAVAAGAAAYLTTEEPAIDGTSIEVLDTAEALIMLAAWARTRLDIPVVGITGSVGKTSTKDLTAAALGATKRVTANERSFNNEQGLPVTILGTPADAQVLVVEMGMRGFGEIARLCRTANPTIGVVTAVASSHTGRVGGIEGVAMAKRELVEALPASGTAVLNADDARVAQMGGHTDASVVTYGSAGDVRFSDIELDALVRPRFRIDSPWGGGVVQLAVSGAHMVANAAAALAVTGVVTGSIDAGLDALADARVSGMRMEVGHAPSGAVVINDAYNANPDSMRAALEALAGVAARRRMAILGEMAELDDPAAAHPEVLAEARRHDIEVVASGTDLYGIEPVSDPVEALGPLGRGDAVLVKASRSAGLERWATRLLEG